MRTLICVLMLLGQAHAWEAETHAGLTERAALASTLHRRLAERLGRPLGLYDPLRLSRVDAELGERLRQLDPEGGFAPELKGAGAVDSALGWLVAGAVLEGVPAERGRHHFYDPVHKVGLQDGGPGLRTRIAAAQNGIGSVRGIFTGANFDGNGMSALQWLVDDANSWGLARWHDERVRAVRAASAVEREDALVAALLSLGAILHLLEDLGEPAHVHNDYRVAFEQEGGRLERLATRTYGRDVPPPPAKRLAPPLRLVDLFDDDHGSGLAPRTARGFYSPGALPPGRTIDEALRRDYAARLLPEIGAHVLAAIDHQLRGRLEVRVREEVRVRLAETAIVRGQLEVFADDAAGARRRVLARELGAVAVGDELASLPLPAGAAHLAVLVDGVGVGGELLVLSQEVTLLPSQ